MKKFILILLISIGFLVQILNAQSFALPLDTSNKKISYFQGVINKMACQEFFVGVKGKNGKQYYIYFVNINGQIGRWDKQLINMCQQNLSKGQRVRFSGFNNNGKITNATIQVRK